MRSKGHSGEIGHIVFDPSSKGAINLPITLENIASGYAITDIAKEAIKNGAESTLSPKVDLISSSLILKAVLAGDDFSLSLIDTAISYIGITIDSLIRTFDPHAIILIGGLSENEDHLVKGIREIVHSNSLPIYDRDIPILASSFGENAYLMEAFSSILQSVLSLD